MFLCLSGSSAIGAAAAEKTTGVDARGEPAIYRFNIPEQPAEKALNELAQKARVPLLFDFAEAGGVTTASVVGDYTVAAALDQLLAGTTLRGRINKSGVLTVTRVSDAVVIAREPGEGTGTMTNSKTTSRPFFRRIGAALAAVLMFSGASMAAGADESARAMAEPNPQVIEEIMVSARRTSENLQQVPIAVTALTPEMMEQQNIVRSTDLMYAAPSLTIVPGANFLLNAYAVRGLPTGVTTYIAESACCIGNPTLPLMDIASAQVLSGPQGTLFGRSSAAGSVLIEPVRPNLSETGGWLKVRLGDYDRQEFTGAVNVPIIEDRLAIRLAANSTDIEGYTSEMGSSRKLDGQKNQQVRLGVQFESGRFTNYTAASYVHMNQSAPNQVLMAINLDIFPYNLPPAFAPFVYGEACVGAVALGLNPDVPSCVAERVGIVDGLAAALTAENARIQTGGDSAIRRTPSAAFPLFVKIENWSVLNVAEFGDIEFGRVNVSVKDVFSYEAGTDIGSYAADGVGGVALNATENSREVGAQNTRRGVNGKIEVSAPLGPKTDIINNDFNLTFDLDDGLLESVLGYYYTRTESPSSDKGTGSVYQSWSGVLLPDLGYYEYLGFREARHSEKAWYTQSTLDLSKLERFAVKGLSFTAGYRKSWDEEYSAVHPSAYDLATGSFIPTPALNVTEAKSDGYNYLFTLAEQFTDNFMVYVSKSRAYVSGGVNIGANVEQLPNFSPTYDPEIVNAWEAGAKIDFYLGENIPVRLNAAVYNYDYEDIIVNLAGIDSDTGGFVGYAANAAAAELQGFELSGAIKPTENLEIRFSYNYNDAEYTEWQGTDPYFIAQPGDPGCLPTSSATACVLDLSNNPFANMPKRQWNVTVAYDLPLEASLGRLTLSANVYAQSRVWLDGTAETGREYLQPTLSDAKQVLSQESYSTLNLRADWRDVFGSGFAAAVFVNNATDEVYKTSSFSPSLVLLTTGFTSVTYGPPRMWGVEVSRQF